jgi:cytochrome c553
MKLSPVRRLLIGAIVLITATIGYAAGRVMFRPVERVSQPIEFDHQKHAGELEMECSLCHEFYETGQHSGLPALTTCLGCHEDPEAESPELRKIVQLAAQGENDVFRKLFRLADHTFYSHRRHVAIAEIACENCHGSIAETTTPPEGPMVRISMDFCLDCHRRSDVSSDCTRCHR